MATHRAFLGDEEREFVVSEKFILALEVELGAGIGAICKRIFAGMFSLSDIHRTISLALVEGGQTPEKVRDLMAAYVVDRPIAEVMPLAVAIMETAWFGATVDGAMEEAGE